MTQPNYALGDNNRALKLILTPVTQNFEHQDESRGPSAALFWSRVPTRNLGLVYYLLDATDHLLAIPDGGTKMSEARTSLGCWLAHREADIQLHRPNPKILGLAAELQFGCTDANAAVFFLFSLPITLQHIKHLEPTFKNGHYSCISSD
jgi:hypothetical protein